jgi:hypothetical protein
MWPLVERRGTAVPSSRTRYSYFYRGYSRQPAQFFVRTSYLPHFGTVGSSYRTSGLIKILANSGHKNWFLRQLYQH